LTRPLRAPANGGAGVNNILAAIKVGTYIARVQLHGECTAVSQMANGCMHDDFTAAQLHA